MYSVNDKFTTSLNTYGRMIISIISDDKNTYEDHDIISISKSFNTDICKSVMQTLNIELNGDVIVSGEINVKFGVGTQEDSFEYIDFGKFIVDQSQYVVESDSTKIVAYDYMYKAHHDYEDDKFVYPCTLYELVQNICDHIGITFKQGEFNNSNKMIESNVFVNSAVTYRDIFDCIAQATGLNILINNEMLILRKPQETSVIIDEKNLSSLTLKEKFGPINSLVLSRSEDADTIYRNDESSIINNGLCEIKMKDNPILDAMNRNDYINDIFDILNGIYFHIYDFDSFGCLLLEPGDVFLLVDLKGNEYKTICLNSTITINTGVNEKMYIESPKLSKTDYASSTKEERKDKNTYLRVNKELGQIRSYVEETSQSIYKFETGRGNIFDDCEKKITKDINESDVKFLSTMPLGINKEYMKGKDICISCYIQVIGGILGELGNYVGAEFQVGYADGTKKTYSTRWYLGQYFMQYLLQTSTLDHQERIWAHFKLDDKEITSVSNLKIIIALDAQSAIVANPKVEFGTFPTGYDFDVSYVRDNVETIVKDYTEIKQEVGSLSLQAVSMETEITTIKGDMESVETRLQSTELKLTPTEITAMVNEKIGADGKLTTVKVTIDKNGLDVKNGAISITNNNDVKVLYADDNGNLVGNEITINNLKTTSGTLGKFTIDDKGFSYRENVSIDGIPCTFYLDIHPDARDSFMNWSLRTNNGQADDIVGALTYSGLKCDSISAMSINSSSIYTDIIYSSNVETEYMNISQNLRVNGVSNFAGDINIKSEAYFNVDGGACTFRRLESRVASLESAVF